MADFEEMVYADEDDPDDWFEAVSTVIGAPGAILQWCETGTFLRAKATFELLEPHCKRLGYAILALRDRWTGQIVRSTA